MTKKMILLFARIFVAVVFFYAGITKILEPIENFRGVLTNYHFLPYALIPTIALVLPWVEVIFSVFLVMGYAPRLSALVLASLSVGFMVALVGSGMIFGAEVKDCGCFGANSIIHLSPRQVFFLDLTLFLINLKLMTTKKHPFSLDSVLKA